VGEATAKLVLCSQEVTHENYHVGHPDLFTEESAETRTADMYKVAAGHLPRGNNVCRVATARVLGLRCGSREADRGFQGKDFWGQRCYWT
jgi:hypothetical protein